MGKATIGDVARAAGVSVKTVSRVINNESGVKDATRQRVAEIVKQLDYRPNLNARSLRTRQSYLLGVLFVDYSGNFYSHSILTGAIEACDQAGYNLLIRPLKLNDEGFEPIIKQMHERSKPDGYLICPPLCDDPNVISLMDELDVPYVRIAPLHSEGSPYVRCQEEAASQKAVEHLINLGHQRIAMLSYLKGHGAGAWRLAGYKAALDNYNIPIVSEYIEEYGYDEEPNILDTVIRRLLTKTSVRPTAIFCVNDTLAASVYRIASQMGLKIPYDISIVGFDDDPMVENLWPPLTTIRQPISTMGNYAARMLIKALGNKQQALELPALDCELVLRSSTGPYLPD